MIGIALLEKSLSSESQPFLGLVKVGDVREELPQSILERRRVSKQFLVLICTLGFRPL
jgi:hypothetical protein